MENDGFDSHEWALDLKPSARSMLDYIFLFAEMAVKTRQKLYANYASTIEDENTFYQLMDQITENHTSICIKNMENRVFWHRAGSRSGSGMAFWASHP